MNETYLEITFHHGKPIAAYYYLPRRSGQKVAKTTRADHGLLIDYADDGEAIGIEITAPAEATLTAINQVLRSIGRAPAVEDELAPLHTG